MHARLVELTSFKFTGFKFARIGILIVWCRLLGHRGEMRQIN